MLVERFKKPVKESVPPLSSLVRMLSDEPGLRDAYGALYAAMRLDAGFGSGVSVLVTSARPNEGKSTVASSLAITAALAGQRTLLVDGDLRRPWLAAEAGLDGGTGLGEMLEGRAEAAQAVHAIELLGARGESYSLSVMCAGQRSPDHLPAVDWPAARVHFQALAKQFGIVLLDSPPILAAKDALLLAGLVDAVILVVAAEDTDRDDVKRARALLEPTDTKLLGAVLNKFDPKRHGRSSEPYSSHYFAPH
jgi:capsular exopolysaccharide synthesis family protein